MKSPTSFIPSHSAPFSTPLPEPTRARVVDTVPAFIPPRPVLPPAAAHPHALLTVRASGDVTLTKSLLLAIPHLRGRGPVDLVPPAAGQLRGGLWFLDTRATASRRLPAPGKVARFRIPTPSRTHFVRGGVDAAPGKFGGAFGTAGTVDALTFALGPEVPGHPGYFELLPVRETV